MASQKILIVDDSKTIRMQVKEMLPKGNFEILEAQDGVEGLDLINQEYPTLVLLDFFMPRMNGWEVLQKIQTNPKLKNIPVVMMSGRREDVEQTVPELFDYFEFVGKPFEQTILVKAIKSAMAKARSRQQVLGGVKPVEQAASTKPTDAAGAIAATATNLPSPNLHEIYALKAEINRLSQENVKLKTDVEGLQKQINQILLFIRQRMK